MHGVNKTNARIFLPKRSNVSFESDTPSEKKFVFVLV